MGEERLYGRSDRLIPGSASARGALLPLLFILMFLTAGLAGCLGPGDEPLEEASPDDPIQTLGENDRWFLDERFPVDHTVAIGAPYVQFVNVGLESKCPNGSFVVELPPGAHHLLIEVDEPAVNASEPGAGFVTLTYRHDGGSWHDQDGEEVDRQTVPSDPPSEQISVNISEPEQGTWEIELWPHGPVVNERFHVAIESAGESGPEEPIGDLAEDGRFGAECGRA